MIVIDREDERVILAVAHLKRRPGYWLHRRDEWYPWNVYDDEAKRREPWRGDEARSLEELNERNDEFWASVSPEERFLAVFALMEQLRVLGGDDGPPPRLDRTVGGVRPRKG